MKACFTRMSVLAGAAALVSLSACQKAQPVDAQLRADLEAASAGGIELAPMGAGTMVVSGVEQVKRAQPRPTAPRPQAPPAERQVAESPDPAPVEEPRAVQQATKSSEPAAARPRAPGQTQQPPPGGYKTVGEVIRNAPFPIKP
jgi:hypothetical protein